MSILDTAEYRRLALIAAGVDPCDIPCILDTAMWRRLMLQALYDLSQGGGGGGGGGYVNGSVQFYADLPVTVGTPAVNTAYLVRENSGVWFINRRPAGIYVRLFNNGNLDDWDYAGAFPEVNDSQYFRIYDSADPTKELALDVSEITTATTRTLRAPDRNGRIAVSDYRVVASSGNLVRGDVVAADTTAGAFTLTLPASPSNGDTVSILDYAGTFDTNNLIIARNGSNIESLAEDMDCNIEDAAFSLVYVGSTVGWKVVPYFGNKTNFASPDPIGSVVPNTGAFTSLTANTVTANNGTLTASAPVLDLSQTWNDSGTAFTAVKLNITNTASAFNTSGSKLVDISIDGSANILNIYRSSVASPTHAPIFEFGHAGVTSRMRVRTGGGVGLNFDGNIGVGFSLQFGVSSGTNAGDVNLSRDAADTLALVRGTNPQTFNIYNTFTNSSNHERGFMRWSSNVLQIGTEAAGTGTNRNLEFHAGGTVRFTVNAAGGVTLAGGAAFAWGGGATRIIGATFPSGLLQLQTGSTDRLTIDANGIIGFGGTTSSFPALKRSSTTLQVRLANDTDFTAIQGKLTTETAYTAGAPTATGYLVLYDSNGTAYKVPAEAL